MLKDKLKTIYFKEMFAPGFLAIFINPFYFARKGLYKNISSLAGKISGKTLDIGCGSKPYEDLYNSSEYVGLEYDTPEYRLSKNADYFYDGKKFPFENESFDSAVANQVFEHVFNPDNFLTELHRILKPGGMLLMTMPFVWDEHEQPYDFARYSSYGIRSLLEGHGFDVVEQRKSVDDIRVIFQLINAYLLKKLVTKNAKLNQLYILLFMSPFNIIGELLNIILPSNADLYLDNIILARKAK